MCGEPGHPPWEWFTASRPRRCGASARASWVRSGPFVTRAVGFFRTGPPALQASGALLQRGASRLRMVTVSTAAWAGGSAVSAMPDTTRVMSWSTVPAFAQVSTVGAVM